MERNALHDFGRADSIDAEAVGQPGQRRFRLLVKSGVESAALWMEKQQLASIGDYLAETCQRLDAALPGTQPDHEPDAFGAIFSVDFRIGQISLGYAEADDLFVIQAYDQSADEIERPSLRCQLSRGQARVLARRITSVVAAGRPVCPLCGQIIGPEGHACPRSNGHSVH